MQGRSHCYSHSARAEPVGERRSTIRATRADEQHARDFRRLRDEIGSASPDASRTSEDLVRALDDLRAAHARIAELEQAQTPQTSQARNAIAEAQTRRHQAELAALQDQLRKADDDRRQLAERLDELERALDEAHAAAQTQADLEGRLADLQHTHAAFDADLAASVQLLHERASDILLAGELPAADARLVAEASTHLADSVITFARERRLAEQAQRPRRAAARAGRKTANGDARAPDKAGH